MGTLAVSEPEIVHSDPKCRGLLSEMIMTLSTSLVGHSLFSPSLPARRTLLCQDLGLLSPEAHRISSVQAMTGGAGPKGIPAACSLLQRCAINVRAHARAAAAPGGCEGTTAAQSSHLVGSSLNGLLVMSEKVVVMVEEDKKARAVATNSR